MLTNAGRTPKDFKKSIYELKITDLLCLDRINSSLGIMTLSKPPKTLQKNGKYQEIVNRYYAPSNADIKN